MISDAKKWHYLAVTNLSAFLAKKSSNHDGDLSNKLKKFEEIRRNM